MVNAKPPPLYRRETTGTHCTVGWVGPAVGVDGCGKISPHRDSIPGPSSPMPVAVPANFIRTVDSTFAAPCKVVTVWEHRGRLTHRANQAFLFNRQCAALKWQHFCQPSNTLTAVLCAQHQTCPLIPFLDFWKVLNSENRILAAFVKALRRFVLVQFVNGHVSRKKFVEFSVNISSFYVAFRMRPAPTI